VKFPVIEPLRLSRRREPFEHLDWLFEIKHDGFRAIAYVRDGVAELVSRNGNTFKSFSSLTSQLGHELRVKDCILDGEIVCLDREGRSQFDQLLFHRGEPFFFAFDCVWLDGVDLRYEPLHERKEILRTLIKHNASRTLFVDHIEARGKDFFKLCCEHDLEGIVAKHRFSPYLQADGESSWIKVRNSHYSQIQGRDELFEPKRRNKEEEAATDGWGGCVVACMENELFAS
jgi:bifunctional non-homologous end joining protein LigD